MDFFSGALGAAESSLLSLSFLRKDFLPPLTPVFATILGESTLPLSGQSSTLLHVCYILKFGTLTCTKMIICPSVAGENLSDLEIGFN